MIHKKLLVFSSMSLLLGCHTEPPPTPAPAPEPVKRQVSQIETAGIKVIQHGDRLTMVIPTDQYFESRTTRIKPAARTNLQAMAQFVKAFVDRYPNSIVRVTGYTDQVFSYYTQLELSRSYAEAVGSYIFNAGVDRSRLAMQGRGNNEPIAGESSPSSIAMNRRVVVQVN